MSSLKSHEKVVFEKLFDRKGYVLDFSDRTFSEFFREHRISIDDQKYRINGDSKMKRLRGFWELETDIKVAEILEALLLRAETIEGVIPTDKENALKIIRRLKGEAYQEKQNSENDFLGKSFSKINFKKLNLEPQFEIIIKQRIDEINKSLKSEASLSVIFLCGSTLEGLLLDAASKNIANFNKAKSAPTEKDGTVKKLHTWTLESLINVSHEVGLISLDVKKYGHTLRDFRNYIHPREQASQNFNPDPHTAAISWQVLQAAIADLMGERE